jgi:thiamine biosynthesis lipoprotein
VSGDVQTFAAMGCEVVVAGADVAELDAIRTLFAARDAAFSRFRMSSELSRVNRSDASAVVVSELFAATLDVALHAAALTGGLVDPTLGGAIEAAGYDRDFAALTPDPRPAGPADAGRWTACLLRGRLLARPAGMRIDLNGVVKSLAVDDSLELFAGDGFVSAGGDVAVRGGVLVSLPGGGSIRLREGGLATSGRDRRRWLRGNEPQHHLIDPRTGAPSTSRWRQVTVAAGSCLAADVAAKAAFLLGDDGPDWLDDRGLPGRFVAEGEIVATDAWTAATETPEESWSW